MRSLQYLSVLSLGLGIFTGASLAQAPASQPAAEKKPVMETPAMRLTSARNIYVTRVHGSQVPFDVIRSTIEGWGRFTMVESADKADLIVEIYSSGDSGIQVSSTSQVSPDSGHQDQSTSTRKDLSPTEIKMTVIDAKNKRVLWISTESAKFAVKEKAKENNVVEAAEHLAIKFHDRLEQTQVSK